MIIKITLYKAHAMFAAETSVYIHSEEEAIKLFQKLMSEAQNTASSSEIKEDPKKTSKD